MQKVPVVRKHQCDVTFVCRRDHFRVADRTARRDHGRAAGVGCRDEAISEWKESIARARRATREVTRAFARDAYGTHAIGLTRADAARYAVTHDGDA